MSQDYIWIQVAVEGAGEKVSWISSFSAPCSSQCEDTHLHMDLSFIMSLHAPVLLHVLFLILSLLVSTHHCTCGL